MGSLCRKIRGFLRYPLQKRGSRFAAAPETGLRGSLSAFAKAFSGGVLDLKIGGISAVFLNAGASIFKMPATESTLPCSSTQAKASLGKERNLVSLVPYSIFNQRGKFPSLLKPSYQRAASVSSHLGRFFRASEIPIRSSLPTASL